MKQLTQTFVKHPIAVVIYTIYAALWFMFVKTASAIGATQHALHPGGGYCATGIMAGFLLMLLITAIYLLVTLARAILGKQKRFYVAIALLIIVPVVGAVLFGVS